MPTRTLTLLMVLGLVIAACNGSGTVGDTTSTTPTSTTTTAPPVEAVQLSYRLEPGTSYLYEVDLDQTIDMTSTGDPTALGAVEDEEVPAEMAVQITGTSIFTYAVADGPEPGTFEIGITGEFSDLEFSGTVDGEPVESSEIPEMAEMEPVDLTVVVDEQGNVIPEDQAGPGEGMFGDLGGLQMLDRFGAGGGTGQFLGPPLSTEEVGVGDTWSETVEVPTMPGEDPISTRSESEVVGTETIDGVEVFVIETTTSTSALEFDLAELLVGFMTSFTPEDMSEEERAELDALVDQLRFAFSIDPQVAESTTWFDPEAGLVRQAEWSGDTHMVIDLNIPDETDELVEFGMDMDLSQSVTYRLTGTEDNA